MITMMNWINKRDEIYKSRYAMIGKAEPLTLKDKFDINFLGRSTFIERWGIVLFKKQKGKIVQYLLKGDKKSRIDFFETKSEMDGMWEGE